MHLVSDILDNIHKEFLDLKNDLSAHHIYDEKSLKQFLCDMFKSYPEILRQTFQILLPFALTYL